MSVQELNEWYDYYQEEPFLADRIEIQIAVLSAVFGNSKGLKHKVEDYLVSKCFKPKVQTLKEFEDGLKAMFVPFARKKEGK